MMEALIRPCQNLDNGIDEQQLHHNNSERSILADFGFVKLDYFDQTSVPDRLSQFIRITSESSDATVAQSLIDAYQLSIPDIILSIQTDDINIDIEEESKRAIQRGLIETAKITNAWVTTSGINNLVNSLVGEALCSDTSEVDVPCIGFCNLKHIGGQDRLQKIPTISRLSTRCIDRFIIMEEEGTTRNNIIQTSSISLAKKIRKSLKIKEMNNPPCTNFSRHSTNTDSSSESINLDDVQRLLDGRKVQDDQPHIYTHKYDETSVFRNMEPNHTHFLLFDGEINDVETTINCKRQNIERELSLALNSKIVGYRQWNEFCSPIPIVILLFGGNRTTLRVVCDGLENGTPLVVIRRTGQVADIIVDMCDKIRSHSLWDAKDFNEDTTLLSTWKTDYNSEFYKCKTDFEHLYSQEEKMTEEEDAEISRSIQVLTTTNKLIVVFDPTDVDVNLEDAIAQVLLYQIYCQRKKKGHTFYDCSRKNELRWCLIWNKIDHAKQRVFVASDTAGVPEVEVQRDFIERMATTALFEALCRDNAFFSHYFIQNGASIHDLNIQHLTSDEFSIFCARIMNKNALPLHWNPPINTDVVKKSWKFIKTIYLAYLNQYLEDYITKKEPRTWMEMLCCKSRRQSEFQFDIDNQFDKYKIESLYLWSIFMNQPNVAKLLCSRCQNPTVATLLVVEIYKKAAKVDTKGKAGWMKTAKAFDLHSKGIIDECFVRDNNLATDLLSHKATPFFNCTPLEIAQVADCTHFLASDTIQKYVHRKWYHYFDKQWRFMNIMPLSLSICLASLFLPLLPIASILFPALYKRSRTAINQETNKLSRCRPILSHRLTEEAFHTSSLSNNNENFSPWKSLKSIVRLRHLCHRIQWFYEAPVVRFYYHVIFFFLFLILFSYVLLFDYYPLNLYHEKRSGIRNLPIPISEFVLHIYMLSTIIDQIDQFIQNQRSIHGHFSNLWNWLDLVATIFYLIAFITRLYVVESAFVASKVLLSIDFILWCIRLLYFCTAYKGLGPKLIMIYEMIQHALLIFGCFILIFLFAFSITSWSLLFTNNQVHWIYTNHSSLVNVTVVDEGTKPLKWKILRDVFNWGIWKVFGQVAEPYKDSTSGMDAISENDVYGTFVFIFAIAFVLISNVLLLNVLIAMFNETIGRVIIKSRMLWRYQRFWLVHECSKKTVLPPPLSIFCHLIRLLLFLYRCTHRTSRPDSGKHHYNSKKSSVYARPIHIRQMNLEKEFAEIYWRNNAFKTKEQDPIEIGLENLEIKLDEVKDDINKIVQKYTRQESAMQSLRNDIQYTQIIMERAIEQLCERLRISGRLLTSYGRNDRILASIPLDAKWVRSGITVAGGYGYGTALNQLATPYGLYIDENQNVLIADSANHRIIEWKCGATSGQVVAGGNGQGNRADQLDRPTDVIVDKMTDSLLICDRWNRRVVRWPRRNGSSGETILSNIRCWGLTMDDQRFLYVSDTDKHEVRRYRMGEIHGTVVAGSNGEGGSLNQLNDPGFIFVDREQSVYVSDYYNHRIIKWIKGAKEGVIIAGGRGQTNDSAQLHYPSGLFIDSLGTVFVADMGNHRVMRYSKGITHGTVIAGGIGAGSQSNQLNTPNALSIDRSGHLYIVDQENCRVQRFSIETTN